MKKSIAALFIISLIIVSCQKEPISDPVNKPGINWVGRWNRDSVLLNEVASNGSKTRVESLANDGEFKFNSDSISGVLTQGGNDYAITWFYDKDNDKISISEPDWINQVYTIKQTNSTNMILTGIKLDGSGQKSERILYLRKK
ncbi:MAG: hypothetical protein Q8M15_08880 [Bacteroidota bacterium]|nr:hypothetical protein [Bacteroidota bacterium]